MDKQKLLEVLEFVRSYAVHPDFKSNPAYHLDHSRYKKIGDMQGSQGHKPLEENDVKGLYVRSHWNVHHNSYSVKPPTGSSTLGHVDSVHLGGPDGVRFEVNESGRQQSLRLGQKSPHAYLHGNVQHTGIDESHLPPEAVPAGYSARIGHFFQLERGDDGKPKVGAKLDSARDAYLLPPHPDAVKAHADKTQAAIDAGENMFSWRAKNRAPQGRVFVVPNATKQAAKAGTKAEEPDDGTNPADRVKK